MKLFESLLGHDTWTTQQFLSIAKSLPPGAVDQEFDIGHRTVRATLAHIVRNVESWGAGIAGISIEQTESTVRSDHALDSLITRHQHAAKELADAVHSIAESDLWNDTWHDEYDKQNKSFGASVAHVITHSMHHRAQLLYMFRKLGVETLPEGDVFSWINSGGNI